MLKVILADDEKKITLLMQKLVDWNKLGYEVVGTATDGLCALDLVEKMKPDLLITDIRMPGCDGIELLQRARALDSKIHFIVISGYPQFEYVQQALKYGVEDYLLKPLKKTEIENLLTRLKNKLGEEREAEFWMKKGRESREKAFLEELRTQEARFFPSDEPSLKNAPASAGKGKAADRDVPDPFRSEDMAIPGSASSGSANHSAVDRINREYGFHFGDGLYFAAIVRPHAPGLDPEDAGCKVLARHIAETVRREAAAIKAECAVAILEEGIAAVMEIPSQSDRSQELSSTGTPGFLGQGDKEGSSRPSSARDSVLIRKCFTRIQREIEKQRDVFRDLQVSVSLSERRRSIRDLPACLRQARFLCLDFVYRQTLWRDAGEEPGFLLPAGYEMSPEKYRQISILAQYLDKKGLEHELEESFLYLAEDPSGRRLREWMESAGSACADGFQESGINRQGFLFPLRRDFWFCTSPREVCDLVKKRALDQAGELLSEKSLQEAKPVLDAKRYIQLHYQEELRLEDVSSAVGFNATYFSTLFKKETGQSFTGYLAGLRIQKARELLRDRDLTAGDVAEMVGYRDVKYFSRLFKKITGINPSDYRRLYR